MEGYAQIGTLYMVRFQTDAGNKRLVCAVVENNKNNGTTTLEVVEKCPENGQRIVANAAEIYRLEPIGPILPANGDIVERDGIEFVQAEESLGKGSK